jgi:hypothetical protein
LTVEFETVATPNTTPVVSADNRPTTHDGTPELMVVTIGDATPTTGLPVVESTLVGHTSISLAATVAASRRRVGSTINVNVVDAAAPEYVAEKAPDETDFVSALNAPPTDDTSTLPGVAAPKFTGTETDEPDTSVRPGANFPIDTVFASTIAGIAVVDSVCVLPSGAVTTTLNCTEPEAGADEPSV